MGSVYAARQVGLNRDVAVKLLHTLCTGSDRGRFEREAEILSRLSHPGIPTFYHFGIWQQTPYFAMQLVEGRTLRQILSTDAKLTPEKAMRFIVQVCSAVDYAHRQGIVHRDLTPNNLVLGTDGNLKVLDFGLSYFFEEERQKLTQTGALVGSIHYMSPEQCDGKKADQRSDIYSLACVLYELVVGEPPFQATNPIGVLHKHKHETFPSLQGQCPISVPGGLQEVLEMATQKDPALRYQHMSELETDLGLILSGNGKGIGEARVPLPAKPSHRYTRIMVIISALTIIIGSVIYHTHRNWNVWEKKASSSSPSSLSSAPYGGPEGLGLKALLREMNANIDRHEYDQAILRAKEWRQRGCTSTDRHDLLEFHFLRAKALIKLDRLVGAIDAFEAALNYSEWNSTPSKSDISAMEAESILINPQTIRNPKMLNRAKELLSMAVNFHSPLSSNHLCFLTNRALVAALDDDDAHFQSYSKDALDLTLKFDGSERSGSRGRLASTALLLLRLGKVEAAAALLDLAAKSVPATGSDILARELASVGYQCAALKGVETEQSFEKLRSLDGCSNKPLQKCMDADGSIFTTTVRELGAGKYYVLAERLARDAAMRLKSAGAGRETLHLLLECQCEQELRLDNIPAAERCLDTIKSLFPAVPNVYHRIADARLQLAEAWSRQQNFERSRNQLELARSEDPLLSKKVGTEYIRTYRLSADHLVKQGHYDQAKQQELQGRRYAKECGLPYI